VAIDATRTHQAMAGFGATHLSLVYDGGPGDVLSPRLRGRAIEAVYRSVGINMGGLEGAVLESPGSYDRRANDNNDPFVIDERGFQTFGARAMKEGLLDLAQPLGFDGAFLGQKINVRFASPWLDPIRSSSYGRYLDECAEQVAAGALHWRRAYGFDPPYLMLFNEPLSGNRELLNGTVQDVVDLVKRVGTRLRSEGFGTVRFVVPNEETDERSLSVATAILSDRDARPFVGAIGYHPYPYESNYASVSGILNTAGVGRPDGARLAVRQQLRDLGRQYGLPVWMTEVSNGGVDARSFEDFRARAIHIHDELTYADAAAYFGMNNMWDSVSQALHFNDGGSGLFRAEGNVVLLENATDTVNVTGMGYAIGHYARWIRRGAVRLEATSSSPLLQVTAFRDDGQGRSVVVIINNASTESTVDVSVTGLAMAGSLAGEQSTTRAYWQPLPPLATVSPGSFSLTVPALSVTTVAGAVQR
jgi:O-glycosyl hydrolase